MFVYDCTEQGYFFTKKFLSYLHLLSEAIRDGKYS